MNKKLQKYDLQAAELFRSSNEAILSTVSKKFDGFPFGSYVTYVTGRNRSIYLYASDIAEHTKNLKNNSKACITVSRSKDNEDKQTSSVGILVNPLLWKASIETISFMPLSSTDPFAGVIITDWYTVETSQGERCKLNIFINGKDLKTDNLKVSSFCQTLKNNQWVNLPSKNEESTKLENVILNKAKKLKLTSG